MTEKTSADPFRVIATRLPYIDRRTLSQAWLSALHIASDGPVASGRYDRRARADAAAASPAANAGPVTRTSDASVGPARAIDVARRGNVAGAEIATRRTFDARAAAVARASFQRARSYPPFRSSLSLAVAGERVQLILRRDGATLHVVAICRPEIVETVRRALASADAHLRVRGEAVRSSVEVLATGTRA